MKFIIDAQLPWKLKILFLKMGFDVVHVMDLPNEDRTSDKDIRDANVE
jgi:predicted nuclease of predicted toxin-antitoxin system